MGKRQPDRLTKEEMAEAESRMNAVSDAIVKLYGEDTPYIFVTPDGVCAAGNGRTIIEQFRDLQTEVSQILAKEIVKNIGQPCNDPDCQVHGDRQ